VGIFTCQRCSGCSSLLARFECQRVKVCCDEGFVLRYHAYVRSQASTGRLKPLVPAVLSRSLRRTLGGRMGRTNQTQGST
jgi:hypothetical protein